MKVKLVLMLVVVTVVKLQTDRASDKKLILLQKELAARRSQ